MIGDMPLLSAIKGRLQYHQQRQKVLAENVANADSPGFRPRDLKPFDIAMALHRNGGGSTTPARTNAAHLGASGGTGSAQDRQAKLFEATPSGNAVNLEDEMMRLSQNSSDYQLATTLYTKSMSYLKIALGKRV
ncbi:MAG: flagellar basal body rod protein FlgB [Beijerinckiaceae bacterium]